MFRGRTKGRVRARGSYGSTHKVPLKGLFSDGTWKCNCDPRLPAQQFQTKNGGKNHGRWFYTCHLPQSTRCDFFLWFDEAKPREAAAVLNNSHTEPLPSPSTPQKTNPKPTGLATPQTITPFKPSNPENNIQTRYTPYSPSKPPRNALSSSVRGSNGMEAFTTTATATQSTREEGGEEQQEEFYDWPASDDEELSNAADQASSSSTIQPPPETPRKAIKTDAFSTPGKRTYDEMHAGFSGELPTPSTTVREKDIFTTPSTNRTSNLFSVTGTETPDTPTPNRLANPTSTTLSSSLLSTLSVHGIRLPAEAKQSVEQLCEKHELHSRGVLKGRDVSRIMVKTRDSTIADLRNEIEGLRAERETLRGCVRHLKRGEK